MEPSGPSSWRFRTLPSLMKSLLIQSLGLVETREKDSSTTQALPSSVAALTMRPFPKELPPELGLLPDEEGAEAVAVGAEHVDLGRGLLGVGALGTGLEEAEPAERGFDHGHGLGDLEVADGLDDLAETTEVGGVAIALGERPAGLPFLDVHGAVGVGDGELGDVVDLEVGKDLVAVGAGLAAGITGAAVAAGARGEGDDEEDGEGDEQGEELLGFHGERGSGIRVAGCWDPTDRSDRSDGQFVYFAEVRTFRTIAKTIPIQATRRGTPRTLARVILASSLSMSLFKSLRTSRRRLEDSTCVFWNFSISSCCSGVMIICWLGSFSRWSSLRRCWAVWTSFSRLAISRAVGGLGLGHHLVDPGEGPPRGGAAADADEVGVSGELLDDVLDKAEVVVDGLGHLHAHEVLGAHGELVVGPVAVGDEDDGALLGGLAEVVGIVGGLGLLLLALGGGSQLGGVGGEG